MRLNKVDAVIDENFRLVQEKLSLQDELDRRDEVIACLQRKLSECILVNNQDVHE